MSSGLDEKQPVTLIVSSNKIAAVEARVCIIVTYLSLLWRRISYVFASTYPWPYYRHLTASYQLHTCTKVKKMFIYRLGAGKLAWIP